MKRIATFSLSLAIAVLGFSGCNCAKKMSENFDQVIVKCTPEVMVLNNGKVDATVSVTLPTEYIHAKAIVKVTPVMVYNGGEVVGQPYFYQGSKVKENYRVATSNKLTDKISFNYTPAMRSSKLQLRVEVKCYTKSGKGQFVMLNTNSKELVSKDELEILTEKPNSKEAAAIRLKCGYWVAKGVNTLQQDFKYGAIMDVAADSYKRVTNTTTKADIIYSINSSKVASKSVKSQEIDTFKANIDAQTKNDRATQKLYAKGYASPDGKETLNDKLSKSRSESGKKAMEKLLKDYGLSIDAAAYGEDWDGFKELVMESNIQDKNLILQVLSLYSSATQRESEIKNMTSVFGSLKSEVLPQLRRTQMVNSTDVIGKSDAEMMVLVNDKKYNELTLEEALHVSSNVIKEPKDKVAVLKYAAETFNDSRAYNNLGVAYTQAGQLDNAMAALRKSKEAEVSDNMALVALAKGDVADAKNYAKSPSSEVSSALAAAQGDYSKASQLSGYNRAVAQTLKGEYKAASASIDSDNSADADYLRAVIAAKQGNTKLAGSQLKSAVSKDSNLAQKAKSDVNLANLFESGFKL